ncbi:TonB-dependent receptor [Novosphingobium profundi]|uniref:TonB-dependent receptor n=1 Tax=Novosphingobium profundi TaxID=1774954 RepID=UPI001BDAA279|nr:TonB-dependent receptor [Novosphingobium profundi]MBT0669219.1 TonB-dependent receptor [Novosphingobium profundi]
MQFSSRGARYGRVRRRARHHFATTAGALAALGIASPALARQEAQQVSAAPQADEGTVSSPSSVGTGAQDAGDILVTARRRKETVQSVPIAIAVVGGEHIDSTGSFNVGRLQQLVPTLQYYSSNPRNTAVNIRGIGVPFGLTNDGIEQGVGIYVDDVYFARVASATFDFLDVERIEVLRGPQGTLYGKNTTAGAINISTRQPTFDFEGRAEVSIGNLAFRQAKAAVSGPLSQTVAVRLALSSTSRRGTIWNTTSQRWINEQDNLGLRAQVLWQPTDTLSVTLAGDYSQQDPECCGTVYVRTGATQRALNRQYAALAAAQGYQVPSTDPFARVTDLDASLNAGNKVGGASLRAVLETGLGTLTSITAWRFWDWKPENDRDFTGLAVTTLSQNPSQQDQFTQELRLAGGGERIDYTLGAFYFRQSVDTQGSQQQGPAASAWLLSPSSALSQDPSVLDGLTATNNIGLDNTSAALYGQLNWHIVPGLTLRPGLRLNYDSKDGDYLSVVTNGEGELVTYDSTDPRIVAQRGVLAPQAFGVKYHDWNLSYDATLSYEAARDVLLYATYARSFKSGGVNLNGVPSDASGAPILAAATVAPEKVNHYEIGVKSRLWDHRLTINLAAFRTDIANYQALVTNGSLGVLRGYLANADAVRTQGVEADISLRPSARFNAYFNGAWTDATYRRFTDAPCPPELSGGTTAADGQAASAPGTPGGISPQNCDISGQRLPGVSEWSLSYGVEGNAPVRLLGQEGAVFLGIDGSTRSNFSSNPSPSAYTWVDGYTLTNLRTGFRTEAGFEIYLWARNLFDTDYFEQLQVPSGNTGLIVGNPGDPRTYGLTLRTQF